MSVRIVTDSAADLSRTWQDAHGVVSVPLVVEFGGERYQDGIDLTAEDFLRQLPDMRELPHTAAPPPGAFLQVYEDLFSHGADGVLSIHLAGGLSSTVRSAEAGARQVDGPVRVVDGYSASLGTGLLVWWASVRAESGTDLETLAAEVETLKTQLFGYAAPVTLEYLARGGRIGQAARLVGTILDMKPILLLENGGIRPERKVRGERQIIPGMLASLADRVPEGTPLLAALGHSGDGVAVQSITASLEGRYRVRGWLEGVIGPVISTHAGPGAFGLLVLPLTEAQDALWSSVSHANDA